MIVIKAIVMITLTTLIIVPALATGIMTINNNVESNTDNNAIDNRRPFRENDIATKAKAVNKDQGEDKHSRRRRT